MIDDLRKIFGDNITACITESNNTRIEVYDCYDCIPTLQRSYIKTETKEPVHFILQNPNAVNVIFAALDNCLLKAGDQSRCDFLIGNKQKLYFVEIKQVSTKQRSAAKADAVKQLDASIELLKP